ncbi:MAG: UDP-GlcNAc:undecaprenyl-phosphate/decaprenyl-phosphate GlcNAc-phosphate transferase [Pyrinomonadaceae bacterium]|jgi:UDP-GlcNAc:undecaprenyl-phosphate GlcNAc-1-phosphate transferase|nr:UDP-GlcNAc:undecaprenyl-phosphate/decaprenyl-phosphate GlcNAc-phosphate transferase [Pyrinomonadaceae bacterium]
MPFSSLNFLAVAAAAILALALTPLVRLLARRIGIVAKPKTDRWHKKPTAMLGGVAIWLSVVISYFAFIPRTPYGLVIVTASTFLFLVGLVDDFLHTKPYQKLIGQVMGSAFVIYYGLSLPWTSYSALNVAITIFWLIGVTNAVNLLDNMDGLATGIAVIAAGFLALSFLSTGQFTEALMLMTFAGALLGFLVYNSNPASIFMGDSGSMFIGFFLASAALVNVSGGRSRSLLPVLAVPILVLFIPIFDTTFVTILRKFSGRAASRGGRDHTSHRLVALGMSERHAVWMLYGFAALSGVLALLVQQVKLDVSLAAIAGFTVLLTLVGVYLAGVKVYDETEEALALRDNSPYAFLVDLSYKRRIFEVLLDVILILLSYWCAYAVKFGALSGSAAWTLFLRTLPVLVFVKMAAFLVMGIYRGIWRYTSLDDLIVFAKAVVLSSVLSVLAVLFAFRFEGFSRTIFIIDGVLMFMFLAGSRMAFRLFRQMLPAPGSGEGRRVLIYGAGDGGELLLRELQNNRALKYAPIGFVDDDPAKSGKVIHGLKVYGGNGDLSEICRQHEVDEVLISSSRMTEDRLQEILGFCREQDIAVKRMRITIEDLTEY